MCIDYSQAILCLHSISDHSTLSFIFAGEAESKGFDLKGMRADEVFNIKETSQTT